MSDIPWYSSNSPRASVCVPAPGCVLVYVICLILVEHNAICMTLFWIRTCFLDMPGLASASSFLKSFKRIFSALAARGVPLHTSPASEPLLTFASWLARPVPCVFSIGRMTSSSACRTTPGMCAIAAALTLGLFSHSPRGVPRWIAGARRLLGALMRWSLPAVALKRM